MEFRMSNPYSTGFGSINELGRGVYDAYVSMGNYYYPPNADGLNRPPQGYRMPDASSYSSGLMGAPSKPASPITMPRLVPRGNVPNALSQNVLPSGYVQNVLNSPAARLSTQRPTGYGSQIARDAGLYLGGQGGIDTRYYGSAVNAATNAAAAAGSAWNDARNTALANMNLPYFTPGTYYGSRMTGPEPQGPSTYGPARPTTTATPRQNYGNYGYIPDNASIDGPSLAITNRLGNRTETYDTRNAGRQTPYMGYGRQDFTQSNTPTVGNQSWNPAEGDPPGYGQQQPQQSYQRPSYNRSGPSFAQSYGNAVLSNVYGGGNSYGGFGHTSAYPAVMGLPISVSGGGYTSGGTRMSPGAQQVLANLTAEYQQAYDQGRAANENRYNQILGGQPIPPPNPQSPQAVTARYSRTAGGVGGPSGVGQRLAQRGSPRNPTGNTRPGVVPGSQGQAVGPHYNAARGGYYDRYERNMGYLDDAQAQARRDIDRDSERQAGAALQNLNNRGLLSSATASSELRGVEEDRQRSIGRLNEAIRQERLATDMQLSGDTLAFMERRQDNYPSLDSYAQLMMQLGQSGYFDAPAQAQPTYSGYWFGSQPGAQGNYRPLMGERLPGASYNNPAYMGRLS